MSDIANNSAPPNCRVPSGEAVSLEEDVVIRSMETLMKDTRTGDRIAFFLLGSAVGAAVALLVAPESGARTRRTLRRKGEDATDYVVDAGKDLVERCEELYKHCGELVGDAAQELSEKYRALYERSKALVDEATAVIRPASKTPKNQLR